MEWISVGDELPPIGEGILAVINGETCYAKRTDDPLYDYNFIEDDFDTTEGYEYNAILPGVVKYWMPKPKPKVD
jgi:hypothetical protein